MNELLVVKVGTSTLVDSVGNFDEQSFYNIAEQVKRQKAQQKDVILVTSGAVSAGANEIGRSRCEFTNYDNLSALAAIGQVPLMRKWQGYLEPITVAQNLITPRELQDTHEGKAYIRKLVATLGLGALAVVNENDAVADEEIKVGDNDQLSARIAVRMHALGRWSVRYLMLSDVDGLYDSNPDYNDDAVLIREVTDIDAVMHYAYDSESKHGTGKMDTKFAAARIAKSGGVEMVLANGRESNVVERMLRNQTGTRFMVG